MLSVKHKHLQNEQNRLQKKTEANKPPTVFSQMQFMCFLLQTCYLVTENV